MTGIEMIRASSTIAEHIGAQQSAVSKMKSITPQLNEST